MPASLVQTFRAFAYNNAWANHRMLTACAGLSQAEFAAARTGFFPSLQATLNHIHVIDLFYVDALEGGWLGPEAWANEVPYPAVDALKTAQRAIDQRLIEIARALASNPTLLLLDEPAAGLNSTEKLELHELLKRIAAQGLTILIIDHDMTLVSEAAQHITVLNFGRRIADGESMAVLRHPDVVSAYLGSE